MTKIITGNIIVTINKLKELANEGLLVEDYDENNFQPASYDLGIGTFFKNEEILNESNSSNKKTKNSAK